MDFMQRKEKVKNMGLCFRCLSKSHRFKQCNKVCYHCKGTHHSVLHRYEGGGHSSTSDHVQSDPSMASAPLQRASSSVGLPASATTLLVFSTKNAHGGSKYYSQAALTGKATLMQVFPTTINGLEITVFFDSGNDFSYITEKAAKKLRLRRNSRIQGNISAFGGNSVEHDHSVYQLTLGGVNTTLLSLKSIAQPLYRAPVPQEILGQFKAVPLSEDLSRDSSVSIDILVGLDFYHHFMCPERLVWGGLVAQRTLLGWMLSDPMQTSLFASSLQTPSEACIRKFWELDAIGIAGEGQKLDELKMCNDFRDNVEFTGGRYRVALPWISPEHKKKVINNVQAAKRRLLALDKKLSHDQDLKIRYQEVFRDLENRGMIEEVTHDDSLGNHPVFYLPHRPVVREDSRSTKVRPVFDASAKGENGVSLNDCMETGPNLTPDPVKILLRFRRWMYGLSADIQKLQLNLDCF